MASEQITKVKLRDGGLKGVQVFYEKPTMRQDLNFRDEYDVKYKAPINRELKVSFDLLKKYLRDICSIREDVSDEEIEIIGITSDADSKFVISAKVRTYGEAWYAVNTPKMDESMSDFKNFFEAINVIEELYNEVRSYIKSEKKIDLVQLAIDFAHKDKKGGDDIVATVDAMSEADKIKYCREILEDQGAIVMMDEDLAPTAEQVIGVSDGPDDKDDEDVDAPATEAPVPDQEPIDTGFGPTGFGAQESGKVLTLVTDKDDLGHVRGSKRAMN